MILGLLGIAAALAVLVALCIKKVNIFLSSMVGILIICLFNGMNVYTAISEDFSTGFSGFIQSWFVMFFMGCVFGKVMEITGAAQAVADMLVHLFGPSRALIALPIAVAVLCYGGVSGFVVIFTVCCRPRCRSQSSTPASEMCMV